MPGIPDIQMAFQAILRGDAEPLAKLASRTQPRKPGLDAWFYALTLGQPLPSLPIWLNADRAVSLDLEASYEETCRVLRIR